MKSINTSQIEEIKSLLLSRKTLEVRKILDNLDSPKDELILKDLKDLIRNKGRSSILESEIRDIINKYWKDE